jgi:hypothetical protein
MRNSAEKCYMAQYIRLFRCFSDFFPCICVDLENLDGGSEIRMWSGNFTWYCTTNCFVISELEYAFHHWMEHNKSANYKYFLTHGHPLFFLCLLLPEMLESIQIYLLVSNKLPLLAQCEWPTFTIGKRWGYSQSIPGTLTDTSIRK